MNHINLLNNAISQTDAQPAQPTQANAADLNAARDVTVSGIAQARIADANTPSSAPPESARPSSPAPCLSSPRMTLERFEEELRLWCKEKSGTDEYPNRIRAKEKMIECFKTWSYSLNLSELQLTSLPDAIGSLTGLQTLDLPENQLTSLPDAICSLTDLKILNLSDNRITSLPDSIGSLTSLQKLFLIKNQLTTIPDAFCSLTGLQTLNLSDNQLTSLPEATRSLTGLQTLNLSDNQLTSLSEAICSLTGLQTLNLCNNRLTSLPNRVGSLTGLCKLYLSGNQFASLPDTIGLPTSLQILHLANNHLTSFPDAIGSLTRLNILNLSGNPFTSLPDSILDLPTYSSIELSFTALSVEVLTHLREETARALYCGPHFSYSMPRISMPQEQPLATTIPELYRIIGRPGRAFPSLEAIDQSHHLRSWLNRLSCTATYRRGGDAQGQFVSQIIRYLETAEENEEFRSILMPILSDASETCGDRVALSILHVGVQHRLHHFDLNDPKGLSQFLICGPMTLSILEQYARELIPTFPFVDEIEVYLGLPIMLKDRLNIPIDISEMLYFRCSNLTEAHLGIATARVNAEIDDLGTRHQFLIGQPKWLEALEKRFPTEMAAFQEEYLQKLESALNPLSVRAEYEEHLKTLTKQLLQ